MEEDTKMFFFKNRMVALFLTSCYIILNLPFSNFCVRNVTRSRKVSLKILYKRTVLNYPLKFPRTDH